MITLHHLNNSRSQRILWLLEELGTPYEIAHYQRMQPVPMAPPELKKVHPLGKSPVITDGDRAIAESGAIVEYLLERYGNGRMRPAAGSSEHVDYVQWIHYAEGSAMMPLLLALYAGMLGDGAKMLQPYIDAEIEKHLRYIEDSLKGRSYLVGNELTGADIMISFVLEAAAARDRLGGHSGLGDYLGRLQARPAYKRALEKGGPYKLMGTLLADS